MYAHNVQMHLVRALARPRLAAGVLTLALLSAACSNSDPASRINAPSLSASMDRGSGSNSGSSGAASNFAVLARTAVSCSGGSITGDVGTFKAPGFLPPPGGSVTLTTGCFINGTVHLGDAAATAAYRSFLGTYAALAPKTGDVCPLITGSLDGQNLTPGIYCVSSEAKTGTLTLTGPASGTWIIKVPSGALTGTNFHVVMAGQAQACNVTWWVDAAATMSTSTFQGNILAGAAISMTGGTLHGNAWAGASGVGDVTFTEGTVVTGCASSNGNGNGNGDDDGDHGHGDKDHGDKDHGDKGHGDKGHENDNHKNDGHSDREGGH